MSWIKKILGIKDYSQEIEQINKEIQNNSNEIVTAQDVYDKLIKDLNSKGIRINDLEKQQKDTDDIIMSTILPELERLAQQQNSDANPPADDTVVGFGASTVGGQGGTSYVVSNLNDSGAGSLREAVTASGARIVTFSVSGDIDLSSQLAIENPNITIDGSTAPNGGICIKGHEIAIATSEVIMKHIRVRPGDNGYKDANGNVVGSNSADVDGIRITGGNGAISNIVIQNCSLSWSIDEVLNFNAQALLGNISDVTIQDCIISEPLWNSHHTDGAHSMNTLITTRSDGTTSVSNITFYRNYFTQFRERALRAHGNFTFEFINNLVYNFNYGMQLSYGATFRMEGNHYQSGANSSPSQAPFFARHVSSGANGNVETDSRAYFNGNTSDVLTTDADASLTAEIEGSAPITSGLVATDSATAVTYILANAGATLPKRDAVDTRVTANYSNAGDLIDTQAEIGGYPDLTI